LSSGGVQENYIMNNEIILIIYLSVILILFFRFFKAVYFILRLYLKNKKEYHDSFIIVRAGQSPFSFFSLVFLEDKQQDERILNHELVHVREKHSFDIMLIEILKIVFWFNPFIYLLSKYLKENHEFAADNKVIEVWPRKTYSEILISQMQSGMQFQITNNFFNSLIKNRIKMMYRSKKSNHWKYLTAVVFGILMIFFTNHLQSQNVTKPDKNTVKVKKEAAFEIVDQMPRFPGCEDKKTSEEKEKCSFEKLSKYIASNLKYPKVAREKGIEGKVIARFIVSKKGNVEDIEILEDIKHGCGTEVSRILESMNNMSEKWIPGKNKGKNVNVYMTLPVIFKLSDKEKTGSKK
jgi:TonB family protein